MEEEEEQQKTFLVDQLIHAYVSISVQLIHPVKRVEDCAFPGAKWPKYREKVAEVGSGNYPGGGVLNKVLYREAAPRSNPYNFIFHFFSRKVHLTFTSYD